MHYLNKLDENRSTLKRGVFDRQDLKDLSVFDIPPDKHQTPLLILIA